MNSITFSWISSVAGDDSTVSLRFLPLGGGETTHLFLTHRALPSQAACDGHKSGWLSILMHLNATFGD